MGSINSEEIISILKTEIENYDTVCKDQEVGTVIWVGDGIATVYGIEHAMYGEIVIFENGVKGMVQDIKRDQVGCILMFSLGVIGYYIAKIYDEVKMRPRYIISEVVKSKDE